MTKSAREMIWNSILNSIPYPKAADIDITKLAEVDINGREIKNVVKVSYCQAKGNNAPLSAELLFKEMEG